MLEEVEQHVKNLTEKGKKLLGPKFSTVMDAAVENAETRETRGERLQKDIVKSVETALCLRYDIFGVVPPNDGKKALDKINTEKTEIKQAREKGEDEDAISARYKSLQEDTKNALPSQLLVEWGLSKAVYELMLLQDTYAEQLEGEWAPEDCEKDKELIEKALKRMADIRAAVQIEWQEIDLNAPQLNGIVGASEEIAQAAVEDAVGASRFLEPDSSPHWPHQSLSLQLSQTLKLIRDVQTLICNGILHIVMDGKGDANKLKPEDKTPDAIVALANELELVGDAYEEQRWKLMNKVREGSLSPESEAGKMARMIGLEIAYQSLATQIFIRGACRYSAYLAPVSVEVEDAEDASQIVAEAAPAAGTVPTAMEASNELASTVSKLGKLATNEVAQSESVGQTLAKAKPAAVTAPTAMDASNELVSIVSELRKLAVNEVTQAENKVDALEGKPYLLQSKVLKENVIPKYRETAVLFAQAAQAMRDEGCESIDLPEGGKLRVEELEEMSELSEGNAIRCSEYLDDPANQRPLYKFREEDVNEMIDNKQVTVVFPGDADKLRSTGSGLMLECLLVPQPVELQRMQGNHPLKLAALPTPAHFHPKEGVAYTCAKNLKEGDIDAHLKPWDLRWFKPEDYKAFFGEKAASGKRFYYDISFGFAKKLISLAEETEKKAAEETKRVIDKEVRRRK